MADDILVEPEVSELKNRLTALLPSFEEANRPFNTQQINDAILKRSDRSAAWKIYIELSTRVISEKLPFRAGEEQSALDSLYTFFKEARVILRKHPGSVVTAVIGTSLLNTVIRKFTAKWHRLSVAGQLSGNDDSRRNFRSELAKLQVDIAPYREALRLLAGALPPPPPPQKETAAKPKEDSRHSLRSVPPEEPPTGSLEFSAVKGDELKRIQKRRPTANPSNLRGISFSGGGIRAAATSLGFAQGLETLWPDVDYLSTVSGGGYTGALIHQELNQTERAKAPEPSKPKERFLEKAARHARDNSNYLNRSVWDGVALLRYLLYGLFLNLFLFVWIGMLARWAIACVKQALPDSSLPCPWVAVGCVGIPLILPVFLSWLASSLDHERTRSIADAFRFVARLTGLPFLIALAGAVILLFQSFTTWAVSVDATGYLSRMEWPAPWIAGGALLLIVVLLWKSDWWGGVQILIGALPTLGIFATVVGGGCLFDWAFCWFKGPGAPFHTHDPLLVTGISLAVVGLIVPGLLHMNWVSPHGFYRHRLKNGFLNREGHKNVKKVSVDNASDDKVSAGEAKHAGPYPLFNATVNLPLLTTERLWDRRSDSFVFSPLAFGSRVTGYHTAKDFEARNRGFDLASAMAVSGAAFAPNMGKLTLPFARNMLGLLNIRLSYWLKKPKSCCLWPCHPGYLIRDLTGWYDGSETYLNVSDGGHFENLGLYELIRRRVNYIVAVDFQADPLCRCDAFAKLICYARNDFGVDIDINWSSLKPNEDGISYRHFVVGHIYYPEDPERKDPGILVYIKPTLTGNEEPDVRAYKVISPQFPFHPLSDQVFDEIQFEAYRSLGEHIARDLIRWGTKNQASKAGLTAFADVLTELEHKLGPEKPTREEPLESSPGSPNP